MDAGASSSLGAALNLGGLRLGHRLVRIGAPDARGMASDGAPDVWLRDFFEARSTPGGLIICRASPLPWRERSVVPGLHSASQVNAWRDLTDAIHRRRGLAMVQLGDAGLGFPGQPDLDGVDAALEAYRRAAENAADAGFDGIELLCTEGTSAFAEDMAAAVLSSWPADHLGVCLSPASGEALRLAGCMAELRLAHLHACAASPLAQGALENMLARLRAAFAGPLILSTDDWTPIDTARTLARGWVDAVGIIEC